MTTRSLALALLDIADPAGRTLTGRRAREARSIAKDALWLAKHGPTIDREIADMASGQPAAARYDRDGGHVGAIPDPTGEAGIRPDPAAERGQRIAAAIVDATQLVAAGRTSTALARSRAARAETADLVTRRHATESERAATTPARDGCASCAQVRIDGAPWWQPVDRTMTIAGQTVGLCGTCRAYALQHGTLMPRKQIRLRAVTARKEIVANA